MAQQGMKMREFKLILVGEERVGKRALVKCHQTGEFEEKYVVNGAEVYPLVFHTNHGPIKFNVWDNAGQEKWGNFRDRYYENGNCAIFMFDLENRSSPKTLLKFYNDMERVCGDIPVVLTGNNVDSSNCKVKPHMLDLMRKKKLDCYEISTKTGYHSEKPFLYLARKLLEDDQLHFMEAPALQPPEFQSDEATKQKYCRCCCCCHRCCASLGER